ncbi:hypothetical protein CLAFUW4_07577 [Fulvia fulva]|uniref:Uncharacterized protein n=1 Tax=Passalora fulva TaxID=5499 RepID=A0A9Q8LJQ6_PASFU|nr:uncharacterized protein CLAFUR5_07707 [Fulvia fulva]KAK4621543.1 hypothetical protein CLAFUR4_07583 [Fulvia fulva]KAK4622859.1 hypothetical protein CLAFUR0_07582 [Fulvia fulva]UJO18474.1 hypothetical protein CLAFUR5_07707 [Fulvia fulva]WPV16746.1 hypothetical protein CLAFUW4_07577 [Fulvia fulva]WPV31698.1 hypothetical protein CLAFUW7_07579 [Fulvia fulva]
MQPFKSSMVFALCLLLGSVVAAPVQLQARAEDLNYDVLPGKQKNPDQVRDTDAGNAY